MSTSAIIAIENEDKTISSTYCHFDGYLEYLGKTLCLHFKNISDISFLVSQGGMSTLGTNNKKLTNDNPQGTDYYYYDSNPVVYKNYKEFKKSTKNLLKSVNYVYIFKNYKWSYNDNETKNFKKVPYNF